MTSICTTKYQTHHLKLGHLRSTKSWVRSGMTLSDSLLFMIVNYSSYIFSDKTGTLTDNSMKFRKMSVAGTAWVHDADPQKEPNKKEHLMHKRRSKGKKSVRKSRDLRSMEESMTLRDNVDVVNGNDRDSN